MKRRSMASRKTKSLGHVRSRSQSLNRSNGVHHETGNSSKNKSLPLPINMNTKNRISKKKTKEGLTQLKKKSAVQEMRKISKTKGLVLRSNKAENVTARSKRNTKRDVDKKKAGSSEDDTDEVPSSNSDEAGTSTPMNTEENSTATNVEDKDGDSAVKSKANVSEKRISCEEFEVDKVIDSKIAKGKTLYLIRWKGYEPKYDSWEPENSLSCPLLLSNYHESSKTAKGSLSKVKRRLVKKKTTRLESPMNDKTKTQSSSKKRKALEPKNSEIEYEVDKVIKMKTKKNGKREFLIRWKDCRHEEDSWEPEENLFCPDIIAKFLKTVKLDEPAPQRELRGKRKHINYKTLSVGKPGNRSKRQVNKQR